MKPCRACGLFVDRDLCAFCRRTVRLIRSQRCVSCTGPVSATETIRQQGRCSDCRHDNVRMSAATRLLLKEHADSRYHAKRVA